MLRHSHAADHKVFWQIYANIDFDTDFTNINMAFIIVYTCLNNAEGLLSSDVVIRSITVE